ncbi:MAG: ABC transporter ATP-binding protein [Methanomassiliicoccales archaeon]|jgi:ABC-2 type transport system ATP-binding protein
MKHGSVDTLDRIGPAGQAAQDDTAIVVERLSKKYEDVLAVDDISFSVRSGEVFSLLGHNGAGKTTTVEILEGLRNPTSGSAHILGVDVTNGYTKIRGKVGILPQDFEPFENLKPIETVEYWGALYGLKLKKGECHELLCSVDLAHRENALSKHLSGGEKRKLGIALAMVNRPQVLFLDEPTTGLDPKARRDLWDLIVALKKKGTTIFLTTHYLDEAEVLSDHIAIMNKGKIVAEGSPRQIIQKFGRKATVTLFGAGSRGLEEMHRQGVEATLQNDDVVVSVSDPSKIEHWFAGLFEAGVEVKDMSIKRDTLEDVFLGLIAAKKAEAVAQ